MSEIAWRVQAVKGGTTRLDVELARAPPPDPVRLPIIARPLLHLFFYVVLAILHTGFGEKKGGRSVKRSEVCAWVSVSSFHAYCTTHSAQRPACSSMQHAAWQQGASSDPPRYDLLSFSAS